jgi:hypothetical protein
MAKKTEVKTTVNEVSVTNFPNRVQERQQRNAFFEIMALMKQVTRAQTKLWGPGIVEFGSYHDKSESGRDVKNQG